MGWVRLWQAWIGSVRLGQVKGWVLGLGLEQWGREGSGGEEGRLAWG